VNPRLRAICDGLAAEVLSVLHDLANVEPGTATETAPAPAAGRQWVLSYSISAGEAAVCQLSLDAAAVAALTAAILGITDGVQDSVIDDTLRAAGQQATASLTQRPEYSDVRVTLTSLDARDGAPIEPLLGAHALTTPTGPTALAVYGKLAPAVHEPRSTEPTDRIDVILDIDLPVVVRFGRTEMSIKALTRIGPGAVIDLGRSPDDPVEILVSDRVVAHGEVVVVGGNYGIRILDVASPAERMRTVEAWQ
jgi:flagellar motor switch protein FliN/FliY